MTITVTMGKFFGNAADTNGVALGNLVYVTDSVTGALVAIYEDDEVTRKPNPFAPTSFGEFEFCMPDQSLVDVDCYRGAALTRSFDHVAIFGVTRVT